MDGENLKIFFIITAVLFFIVGIILLTYKAETTSDAVISTIGGIICLIFGSVIGFMVVKKYL